MLAAVAELAQSTSDSEKFWNAALAALRDCLGGIAARFWTVDPDGQYRLTCETAPDEMPLRQRPRIDALEAAVLEEALRVGVAVTRSTAREDAPNDRHDGADQCALLVAPVLVSGRCAGLIELVKPAPSRESDADWSLDVMISAAELSADFLRRRRLEWLEDRQTEWQRLSQFVERIHRQLDLDECAYSIANDGRAFVGCDRLSVVSIGTNRARVLAVSGSANTDPRSNAVRSLETLVSAASLTRQPLVCSGSSDGLAPQLRIPLSRYLDVAGASALAVIPLIFEAKQDMVDPPAEAALVIEQYTGAIDEALLDRLESIRPHCEAALRNATRVKRIPLSSLFRGGRWQRAAQGGWRWKLATALLAGGVLALLVPADFEIEARGELQPRERRDVFAPDDGIVDELKVDHGQKVASGEILAVLRNPLLDLEFKRIWGDLQTTRKRLSAVQAARIESSGQASSSRLPDVSRLSGEEAGLDAAVSALEEQIRLIEQQQADLTVRSPIDGKVLTWDLPQLLRSRPVQRGQSLMTVADPNGPWILELRVADRRIGHVLDARQGGDAAGLPVTYVLATDPAREYPAVVERIADSVETAPDGESTVVVTVILERPDLATVRPGAGVTGRIHCGRRPLGYVWLHDLIDVIRSWIRF
jgi:multidrug efflux pump subunit AcrA (membrane-fusion protein)